MDESLYQQLHELMGYDAATLKALALFLNANKKNKEFMKSASAELGRNARHMARAVDYFQPHFTGDGITADQALILFQYAQLKHEKAIELFQELGFDFPLHIVRERVAAMLKRKAKEGLAAKCAELVRAWREWTDEYAKYGDQCHYGVCANALAALPEVKRILEAK